MGFLRRIYKKYIYGIIGTLVFHILLVSTFLLAEINIKGVMKEQEILVEFPEIVEDETQTEKPEGEEIPDDPSNGMVQTGQVITNRPSNRLSGSDKFFDDDYNNEIESAKNLVKDVNNQLSKQPVDIDNIKMPVETTEGMDPETIKNRNYSGESNVVYFLSDRYHLQLPIPVYLAQGGGKVIVDIYVNRNGRVIIASPRQSASITDPMIYHYARVAALNTVFNSDPSAPEQQSGSIHYTFHPQ